jgi:predicted ATPase
MHLAGSKNRIRMKLLRFRAIDFRSVADSGWIDVGEITAFLGENEAGKTNILLPLWKLNPAGDDGEIDPLADYPKTKFNDIREMDPKPAFISAEFRLTDGVAAEVARLAGTTPDQVQLVRVARSFDKSYLVSFPEAIGADAVEAEALVEALQAIAEDVQQFTLENELHTELRDRVVRAVEALVADLEKLPDGTVVTLDRIRSAQATVERAAVGDVQASEELTELQRSVPGRFETLNQRATKRHPDEFPAAHGIVIKALPRFVYYSQYGNLDSEIYLPRVIENLDRVRRRDIRGRDAAKARTLKVLFDFVKLSPQEILELGEEREPSQRHHNAPAPTPDEIDAVARRKRTRDILFHAAADSLTKKFRDWWKRGNYIFRFSGDGAYFRIWVSDQLRTEEVELEYRSSGLQWFFSFFLVFLAERGDEHQGAILLLDEPGVTLHPLAQEDLFKFFVGLAASNQIMYTSHSPHLVDPDRLSDVRVVYVNDAGETMVSSNLRASEADPRRTKSIYPVDAALGLSVSRTLLHHADVTIVEGPSDQFYFSYIKTRLIAEGRIMPARERLFVPAGGAKATATTAAILGTAPEAPPSVILDGDGPGLQMKRSLEQGMYATMKDRLVLVDAYTGMAASEVEDLFPAALVVEAASRIYRTEEREFADSYQSGTPIVPQIESFANSIGAELELGWKVRLAQRVLSRARLKPETIDAATLDKWTSLFQHIQKFGH